MSADLNWRYATKHFDPTKEVRSQDLSEILEVLRLAPSSFGLQPWKFIVIKDKALRQKIQPLAWHQAQVTDASHLIILCSLKTMDEKYVKDYVAQISEERGVPLGSLKGYEDIMLGFLKGHTLESLSNWMKRQVYIAFGMLLMECAHRRIDACPMEGFEPQKVDELLGLEKQNIESVALCPIGYRSSDDKYASIKKIRLSKEKVLLTM